TASTSNAFEAKCAISLVDALRTRVSGDHPNHPGSELFWSKVLAVVSPHRAQNSLIRSMLDERDRNSAFVETVDRIQGKERDAVILSYCVSDPEFALAEGDFIYSAERLNVAITRARTKLVVFVSRRLLDVVPADQEVLDRVERLREFVFSCVPKCDL